LKGKKRRAKTDWADARHLRELLLIGRLPESWIAPARLLDLRARVRCRRTLVHQRVAAADALGALSPWGSTLAQAFDAR
jgi:transposase